MKQIMGWRKVCHFYGGLNGGLRGGKVGSAESRRELDKKAIFLAWRSARSPRTDTLSTPDQPEWLSLGKKALILIWLVLTLRFVHSLASSTHGVFSSSCRVTDCLNGNG